MSRNKHTVVLRENMMRADRSILPRKTFIRVEEGSLGYHAIVEGGTGDWASSRISEVESVRECVGRHLLGRAIVDAEAMGGHARVDIRWIANGLWQIESQCIPGYHQGYSQVTTEISGGTQISQDVDNNTVKKPALKNLANKLRRGLRC